MLLYVCKEIMNIFFKKYLKFIPYLILSIFTIAYCFFYISKAGYQIADYEWYNSNFCNFFPSFLSFNIENICNDSSLESLSVNLIDPSWKSPPIYTYIFLTPYFIFRSHFLLILEGFILGVFILKFLRDAAIKYKICNQDNTTKLDLSLCLFSLNIYFIKDLLSVSSNAVWLFWITVCLSINLKKKLAKVIFWSLTFFIRPSSIFIIAPFYLCLFLKNKKEFYKLLKYLPVFVFIYLIAYFSYIRSWPVPIASQALLPYTQGLSSDIRNNKSLELISSALNKTINFSSLLNFSDFFKLFFSKLPFTFFINWLQKLQATLGDAMIHNYFLETKLHTAFFWGNIYYWLILKPSFYLTILNAFLNKNLIGCIQATVILYLLTTSIFAGDPRYSIVASPILIFTLIEFLSKIFSKKIRIEN